MSKATVIHLVNQIKCTPCNIAWQVHKELKKKGNPPKVKQADFIYQGSSMCQAHLIDMVNLVTAAHKTAQKKLIEIPGINTNRPLTMN